MKSAQTSTTTVVAAERACPRCGTKLGGFGPEGLCGACLFGSGLDDGTASEVPESASPALPRFGDYELLGEIARGGMGVVYRARQTGLNRIVALKMILGGQTAGEEELKRFRQEAEAAAQLKHPNIVAIHEVGERDGQPFFSMDFIEGQTLRQLSRDSPFSFQRAAACLKTVAEAVHYAHERGVVHRDLKPGNVLMDAAGQPHVTDFGLAKRIGSDADLTRSGDAMGTPGYMPPEQAGGQSKTVGPLADVYALGAVLYDLLTGRPPFRAETPVETMAQVMNKEPVAPHLLNASVPRDLETICLKCLEKEPARRYASARELALDLGRFLNHEPVLAQPPSAVYRARKFVRRHRVGVAVAACFALVLTAATVISAIFGFQANRDKASALSAESKAQSKAAEAMANAERADALAKESETVLNFFRDKVLAAARPEGEEGGLGPEVTVRRAVEVAERQVTLIFTNNPKVEARIRHTLGSTYLHLGDSSNAISQFKQALAIKNRYLGLRHSDTLVGMDSLGIAYQMAGRLTEAIPLFEKVLEQRTADLGPNDRKSIDAQRMLAAAYMADSATDRRSEVIRLYTEALEASRSAFGPDDQTTINCMNGLAVAYLKARQPTNALPLLERVVEFEKAAHGPDAVGTLTVMGNLASANLAVGRPDVAVPLYLDILNMQQAKLPPNHPNILRTMNNLGGAYLDCKRFDDAIRIFEETVPLVRAKLGSNHTHTMETMDNLARAYGAAGQWSNAVPIRQKLLEGLRQDSRFGSNHSATLDFMDTLAMTYSKAGRMAEAQALQREVFQLRTGTANPPNPTALAPLITAARGHLTSRRFAQAEMLLRKCLEIYEDQQPGLSPTLTLQSLLGASLVGQEDFTNAKPLLINAYEGLKKRDEERPSPTHAGPIKEAAKHLVQLYEAWGKPDEAEQWRQKTK